MIDFGEHVAEKKSLDLTPMLDVVFLLLIFFMLTSIFARPMLPVDLPEAESASPAPEKGVAIAIRADGALFLDERPVEPNGIRAAVAARFAAGESREVSLHADQGVPFGRVVEVMDQAKQAGAVALSVVTENRP
ncbi:MAG: biopolymer transporter ExbD [Thermodesulfobacteriota bacterium]